ncbi:hypothetical protein [Pedobacter nutrimenti]|uniref:hypothetical protein n=1 Tax=Pedobacter nutrimenti TaxID=1241337 RepID=UPI00292D6E9E|nr:hypothetical protein [Pedobacter nutrimenti]
MMKGKLTAILMLSLIICKVQAQQPTVGGNLSRRVNIHVEKESIGSILNRISTSSNFYFSYQGTLFKTDSLVNLSAQNLPVREVLDKLFNGKIDYREEGQYIILRSAALHLTIEPDNITTAEKLYLISGYVTDTKTGLKIKQASVYEKRLLQSTLTDNEGYFKLRFRGDYNEVILTASKESYRDTTLVFLSNITIKPEGYADDTDPVTGKRRKGGPNNNLVERMGIGRFLVSSKQRIQSMNIPDFIANSPFQVSITPGLSSHGMMSSQIVNKASLNLFGGYTAGLNGFEAAGLFNMNKGDAQYLQMAGLFNVVGGSFNGLQAAGILNTVIGDSKGLQMAGIMNEVSGNSKTLQAAGIFNHVRKHAVGFQMAGIMNLVNGDMSGFQAAGLLNLTSQQVNGVQLSGLINYTKRLKGIQIGLLNIADQSDGYSIGLINIVKNGYHKVSLSTNETGMYNTSVKLGNDKFYSILMLGQNFSDTAKVKAFGIGFGHDFLMGKRFSIAAEICSQFLYLGNWDHSNVLTRYQVNLQVKLFKNLSIFGGPAYSVYNSSAPPGSSGNGYKQQIAPDYSTEISNHTRGWFGWNAGLTLF